MVLIAIPKAADAARFTNPKAASRSWGAQVHGDAWVGRIFDNDDDFKRLNFTLAELSSSAAWVVKAVQQMRDKAQQEHPQVVLRRMQEERAAQAGAAPSAPKASVKELSAAEAAKVGTSAPALRSPRARMQWYLPLSFFPRGTCACWPAAHISAIRQPHAAVYV